MAADIRAACNMWRTAIAAAGRSGVRGFEDAHSKVADAVEAALDKALAALNEAGELAPVAEEVREVALADPLRLFSPVEGKPTLYRRFSTLAWFAAPPLVCA